MSVARRDDIKRRLSVRGETLKSIEAKYGLPHGHLSYHLARPSVRAGLQVVITGELGYAYDWEAETV